MSSQHEASKPLVLRHKTEFRMVDMALEPVLDEDDPLKVRVRAATDELGWERAKLTMILRGDEQRIVMDALRLYVVIPPETPGQEWQQAQSAAILGIDLKALGIVAPDIEATVSAPLAVPNLIA